MACVARSDITASSRALEEDGSSMSIPPDAPRLIQNVLDDLGWSGDVQTIVERVRRLNIGLPCEDEFSVLCAWLGKCQILHKLDQQQIPPQSLNEFQVPDLLGRFTTQKSQRPLLIEVKSKNKNVLSFKPEYLHRLKNYAELIDCPLLIAWKSKGLWCLFEADRMTKAVKNFNISFETAMRENLMAALVGDLAYKIGAGAGVHFRFQKLKRISQEETPEGHSENWRMKVDDVAFTDYNGKFRTELPSEVQSLFTAWNLEEHEEHSDSHIHLRYIAGTEGIQFAQLALAYLLNWEEPSDKGPNWRMLLRQDKITSNIDNFAAAINEAFSQKIVSHILHQVPHVMPKFLETID